MTDQTLASGQIAGTSLVTIYAVPAGSSCRVYSFVLTNTTSGDITVPVYFNGGSDNLLRTITIPPGSGNAVSVFEALGAYSSGNSFKVQPTSSGAFNYLITGRVS